MLRVVHRFDKHCICRLQGEYVLVRRFWQPYVRQGVGGALYVIELIGGAEERCSADKTCVWCERSNSPCSPLKAYTDMECRLGACIPKVQ
jgi:hypothetical protein